jgi:hypothetical protein
MWEFLLAHDFGEDIPSDLIGGAMLCGKSVSAGLDANHQTIDFSMS